MNKEKQGRMLAIMVAAILVVDQVVKILVKTNMVIGEDIHVIGNWFLLHFIENEGFAFGMSVGGHIGKLMLTLLRLVASTLVAWYVVKLVKRGARLSLTISLSLIFAGAVGNLIDSTFYGLIFSESEYSTAVLFPPEGGYAPLFFGKVVDMFYFPLFEFDWPMWVPMVGGNHFIFFSAIFNVADAAITIGIVWLAVDQFFLAPKRTKSEVKAECQEDE